MQRLSMAAVVRAAFLALLCSGPVAAAPVAISAYDVIDTPASGFGGWAHTYTGTVTLSTRTISGSASGPAAVASERGGRGTLNDGVVATNIFETQLFYNGNADDGLPVSPEITLFLAQPTRVQSLSIFGGDISLNIIPGALESVEVEIGGKQAVVTTSPFGTDLSGLGVLPNDLIDLSATPLSALTTDRIVLRNFKANFFGSPFNQFSITEITVDGSPPALAVNIDISPGERRNVIGLGEDRLVTVAILSAPGFDATRDIYPPSVTFGRTGDEASLVGCRERDDVNGDRRLDLLCQFLFRRTGLRPGDIKAVLKGVTNGGTAFVGSDSVVVRNQ